MCHYLSYKCSPEILFVCYWCTGVKLLTSHGKVFKRHIAKKLTWKMCVISFLVLSLMFCCSLTVTWCVSFIFTSACCCCKTHVWISQLISSCVGVSPHGLIPAPPGGWVMYYSKLAFVRLLAILDDDKTRILLSIKCISVFRLEFHRICRKKVGHNITEISQWEGSEQSCSTRYVTEHSETIERKQENLYNE